MLHLILGELFQSTGCLVTSRLLDSQDAAYHVVILTSERMQMRLGFAYSAVKRYIIYCNSLLPPHVSFIAVASRVFLPTVCLH